MHSGETRMPTAAYVGFAGAVADAPAVSGATDTGVLLQLLRTDPALPRIDRILSLANGVMAYFEFPSSMLSFAHALGARGRRADWPLAPLRAGIHVATLSSSGGAAEPSLSTRTVDFATRVAAAAGPRQVLASREFHTVITRILKLDAGHFRSVAEDRHSASGMQGLFEILPTGANASATTSLTPAYLAAVERILADEIGPLAKLLVRQAGEGSFDRSDLGRKLAQAIPEGARRGAFLTRLARLGQAGI